MAGGHFMGRASPGRGAEPTQAPPLSKLEAYLCAAKKHGEYQKMARKPTGVSPACFEDSGIRACAFARAIPW